MNSLYPVLAHYDILFIFEGKKVFSRKCILLVAIYRYYLLLAGATMRANK
ncbi:hypothetical protein QFZ28_002844 [Neobacillus niacini]|nr:hypothetical protein [Neobacillus niacini]